MYIAMDMESIGIGTVFFIPKAVFYVLSIDEVDVLQNEFYM
jgi:hypothetical protein